MTASRLSKGSVSFSTGLSPGQISLGALAVFFLFFLLRNPEIAVGTVGDGLRLCVNSVIPSLFPFLIVSEWIVSTGIAEKLFSPLLSPLCRFFRVPRAGGCAVLLGSLCGFPIGARAVRQSLDDGKLSRSEAETVLTFCNLPSPAFLVGTVGVTLFGDRSTGWRLWISCLFSSLFVGFLLTRTQKKTVPGEKKETVLSVPRRSFAQLFTRSLTSSAVGMLTVCAYVIFFTSLVGTLGYFLEGVSCPEAVRALLFSVCELTVGSRSAASLSAPLLAAFAAGWSGLSVHCQILSCFDGCGLSFRRYFLSKCLQGLLCVPLFRLLCFFA